MTTPEPTSLSSTSAENSADNCVNRTSTADSEQATSSNPQSSQLTNHDALLNPSAYADQWGSLCAKQTWVRWQAFFAIVSLLGFIVSLSLAFWTTLQVLSLVAAPLMALLVGQRLLALLIGGTATTSYQEDPPEWPHYAVLVPLYREPQVIPHLLSALRALDYPHDRLDVQLIIEQHDQETAQAIADANIDPVAEPWLRTTVVPQGTPTTKPRACNFALAQVPDLTETVVIYDAEDRPDPQQLRIAARALHARPDADVVQARLRCTNAGASRWAAWATLDYVMWFGYILPGLVRMGCPLPLGGTSNHFRRGMLNHLSGWDPYNVTEDCDLGMKIARNGGKALMIDSWTDETAVTTASTWIRQRGRWIKGYAQTALVHARQQPWQDLSLIGMVQAALVTGGSVVGLLISPLLWIVIAAWLVVGWPVVDVSNVWSLIGVGIAGTLLVMNPLLVIIGVWIAWRQRRGDLLWAGVTMPIAWATQSLAAWIAVLEMLVRPFHWSKTDHSSIGHITDHVAGRWRWIIGGLLVTALSAGLVTASAWRLAETVQRHQRSAPEQLAIRWQTESGISLLSKSYLSSLTDHDWGDFSVSGRSSQITQPTVTAVNHRIHWQGMPQTGGRCVLPLHQQQDQPNNVTTSAVKLPRLRLTLEAPLTISRDQHLIWFLKTVTTGYSTTDTRKKFYPDRQHLKLIWLKLTGKDKHMTVPGIRGWHNR